MANATHTCVELPLELCLRRCEDSAQDTKSRRQKDRRQHLSNSLRFDVRGTVAQEKEGKTTSLIHRPSNDCVKVPKSLAMYLV